MGDWNDYIENVERAKIKLAHEADWTGTRCENARSIKKRVDGVFDDVIAGFGRFKGKGERVEPELFFDHCLDSLDKIDRERFILMNLLEGLKHRSPRLSDLVSHYHEAGILDESPATSPPVPADEPKPGKFVQLALKGLNWLWSTVVDAAVAAVREVLGELAHAVKPIIGVAGLAPVLSWLIDPSALGVAAVKGVFDAVRNRMGSAGSSPPGAEPGAVSV